MRTCVLCLTLCGGSLLFAAEEPAASESRLPVPSTADQSRAQATLDELYAEDLRERSPLKKAELAGKLVTESQSPDQTAAQRYILLQTASELYAQAGDANGAWTSVQMLAEAFEVDEREAGLAILTKTSSSAAVPDKAKALAEVCLSLAEQAILDDDIPAAEKFASLAETAGARARQSDLRTRAKDRARDIRLYKVQAEQAQAAEQTLAANPDDSEAKLALGRFRCFWQDDWTAGLPLLAESADAALKQLAVDDQADPSEAEALAVGHAWWNLAEKESGVVQLAMRHRAAYWYAITLDAQTGLTRSLVEKRIAEVEAQGRFVNRPTSPGSPAGVRGRFLGMCKATGAVWVNGKPVAEINGHTTPVSHSLALRNGDVVVLQVESNFVYRAAKFAFLADDGSCYLPIRRADLRNVTDLDASALTADAIAALEGSPGGGRPEDRYKSAWESAAPQLDASEWFFGPGRGTFRFAFVVDAANFVTLKPRR